MKIKVERTISRKVGSEWKGMTAGIEKDILEDECEIHAIVDLSNRLERIINAELSK